MPLYPQGPTRACVAGADDADSAFFGTFADESCPLVPTAARQTATSLVSTTSGHFEIINRVHSQSAHSKLQGWSLPRGGSKCKDLGEVQHFHHLKPGSGITCFHHFKPKTKVDFHQFKP